MVFLTHAPLSKERGTALDFTEYVTQVDGVCRIFAMVEDGENAAACIREALVKPSYVMPFLEPYLPFYDAVRNEPAFESLLAL